jgi:ABC-type transport system substrate-binding protein
VVGVGAYRRSESRHIRGIQVRGDTISFTLAKPSRDFLARLALPYFCALPTTTPIVRGGLTVNAPPSAGPYYVTDAFNGEYLILKRNPNYEGPRPARLDAIAFREGIADEEAVARVRAGTWDAAILAGALLAPGGAGAREAASDPRLRTEELPVRRIADVGDQGSLYALVSSRLGCDAVKGALELAGLCRGDSGT